MSFRMTRLQMVKEILSDIDADDVDTSDETVESRQVAILLESTYHNMMVSRNWPHLKRTMKLWDKNTDLQYDAGTLSNLHLTIPKSVKEIEFIHYDVGDTTWSWVTNEDPLLNTWVKSNNGKRQYRHIKPLLPEEFLHRGNKLDSSSSTVDVIVDVTGVEFLARNDTAPMYFTSFDDASVVFDSIDLSLDADGLVGEKTQCIVYKHVLWEDDDTFVPDMPNELFRILVEGAKSAASLRITQTADPKAEQEVIRQNRWMARKAKRIEGGINYPDYGRKR